MVKLELVLLSALFLASPAYALESSDSVLLEKDTVELQNNVDDISSNDANKANNTNTHKHHHRKHLSKRPYKQKVTPNAEVKKAEADSPHKHIYQKHSSKRPHAKNESH
jgi:hypothetical protein